MSKEYYQKNREVLLQKAAEYRAKHREKAAEWARNDRKNNPDKYKAQYKDGHGRGYSKRLYDLLIAYGLTKEQYDLMIIAQNNCCYICKRPEKKIDAYSKDIARLCIDHNHETKKVRALLCGTCNSGIGFLRENTKTMHKAIAYLQKHSEAS